MFLENVFCDKWQQIVFQAHLQVRVQLQQWLMQDLMDTVF